MDKTTLGNSANLGIKTDTNLSTLQYNWLGTIFCEFSFSFSEVDSKSER